MKQRMLVVLLLSSLSGCALTPQKHAELSPTNEMKGLGEIVTLPAQLRTIGIKKNNNTFVSCAEPGPDVALSDTFKMITGITSDTSASASNGTNNSSTSATNKSGISNDLQLTTTALELAGRTQTVLLAREFMFRTCEAAANGWIDSVVVKDNHTKIIDGITNLIKSENTKAETARTKAETDAKVATIILDEKVLKIGGEAVRAVIVNACADALTQCISKPELDEKGKAACQAAFITCTK